MSGARSKAAISSGHIVNSTRRMESIATSIMAEVVVSAIEERAGSVYRI